jgi:ABC-type antimicrobial peptide transport system permease subunit
MVAQRSNEIGIRMALGARPRTILSMVVRGAGKLILAGLLLGAGLAVLAGRAANSLLYGLRPYDPATLLVSLLLLAGVSLFAAMIPAERAARVDPMAALRDE